MGSAILVLCLFSQLNWDPIKVHSFAWHPVVAVKSEKTSVCQVCKAAGAISCECKTGDVHNVRRVDNAPKPVKFQPPQIRFSAWQNEREGMRFDVDAPEATFRAIPELRSFDSDRLFGNS